LQIQRECTNPKNSESALMHPNTANILTNHYPHFAQTAP
jgi:hypothetical protein